MMAPRLTRFAVPLAFLALVGCALLLFPDLPEQVPVRYTESGEVARALDRRPFIALTTGLGLLLGAMVLTARWMTAHPEYTADGLYTHDPARRQRVLVALDLFGAAGLLLIAWTAALCAQAARTGAPFDRRWIQFPLLLLVAAILTFLWRHRRHSV